MAQNCWEMGRRARAQGLWRNDTPFAKGSAARKWWQMGWDGKPCPRG